jgi:hypothetical protein
MTEPEKVTVAEITLESYSLIDSLVDSLTTEQEDAIQADVVTWNLIRNSHVRLDGEVDFDNERKREAIRRRVRKHLGLSLVSSEVTGASQSLPHTWIF